MHMVNNINSKLSGKKQIDSDCGAGKKHPSGLLPDWPAKKSGYDRVIYTCTGVFCAKENLQCVKFSRARWKITLQYMLQ